MAPTAEIRFLIRPVPSRRSRSILLSRPVHRSHIRIARSVLLHALLSHHVRRRHLVRLHRHPITVGMPGIF